MRTRTKTTNKKLSATPKTSPHSRKKKFIDKAFGILKNDLSKKSSVAHVRSLRKAWR